MQDIAIIIIIIIIVVVVVVVGLINFPQIYKKKHKETVCFGNRQGLFLGSIHTWICKNI